MLSKLFSGCIESSWKRFTEGKKTVQWLIGEHNRLFADWFEKKVCFLISLVIYIYIVVAVKLDL